MRSNVVRAAIAVMVVTMVLVAALSGIEVEDGLWWAFFLVVGYYFGRSANGRGL